MIPLNNETKWILAQTPVSCHGIATRLRKQGHSIEETPEAEQAAGIHWMLGLYEQHGLAWREKGHQALAEQASTPRAEAPPAEQYPWEEDDEMYQAAVELLKEVSVTTSVLQRRLRIGYNRAARIVEAMQHNGILPAPDAA